jgi:hypothetical protein
MTTSFINLVILNTVSCPTFWATNDHLKVTFLILARLFHIMPSMRQMQPNFEESMPLMINVTNAVSPSCKRRGFHVKMLTIVLSSKGWKFDQL